jgi:hypothetical protein
VLLHSELVSIRGAYADFTTMQLWRSSLDKYYYVLLQSVLLYLLSTLQFCSAVIQLCTTKHNVIQLCTTNTFVK